MRQIANLDHVAGGEHLGRGDAGGCERGALNQELTAGAVTGGGGLLVLHVGPRWGWVGTRLERRDDGRFGLAQALRQLEASTHYPSAEFIGLYPPILVQMIDIGEQSGSLSALLGKAADAQDEALEQQVHTLTQLIEPLMVVVLGGLVGGKAADD